MDPRSILLATLQDCPRLGPSALSAIIRRTGGILPQGIFGHEEAWYIHEFGVAKAAARALSAYTPQSVPHYSTLPVRLLTVADIDYPGSLMRMEKPPPVITTLGNCNIRLTKGSFSVLCSAGMEVERVEEVKSAIQAGLDAGLRVVSGHNRPVYQWALLAAKRTGAPSTMVLDRGFLCAFDTDMYRDPIAAARIWGFGFDSEHSEAISASRLRDAWAPPNGQRRDAMVAALSDTIIVFGMKAGGTIHRLCKHALTCGQRVLADESALDLLSKEGAQLWTGSLWESWVAP